jgi:aminoglycoside 3-N-acetyltransferase
MSEADAIDRVNEPVTVSSLVDDLESLGVRAGDTLLVHTSLSALGWVNGGAPAVVDALQTVLTAEGTLVMPTHSTQYSDPATWEAPPVPEGWVAEIRETRPPYRPPVTPTRGMGAVAECFRTYPGVVRSRHPEFSFAAWGAAAVAITADHAFDRGLGEASPLATVYEHDGRVLLLGVGHDRNTSLHLAEDRADLEQAVHRNAVPVQIDGAVEVVEYEDPATDSSDFATLGRAFEAEVGLAEASVGSATAKLVDQRVLVDFGVDWLKANR